MKLHEVVALLERTDLKPEGSAYGNGNPMVDSEVMVARPGSDCPRWDDLGLEWELNQQEPLCSDASCSDTAHLEVQLRTPCRDTSPSRVY